MAELQATVTHAELMDWAEFYTLEPWGAAPADLRAGIVAATIANVHISREAEPLKPIDFMPRLKAELQAQQAAPAPDVIDTPDMTDTERFALLKASVFAIPPTPPEDTHHGQPG